MVHGSAGVILVRSAKDEVQKDTKQEETIDEGKCWWEKVVIGLGDKFTYLVDEKPNAKSAQYCTGLQSPAIGKREGEYYGYKQQEPAPQGMCDVQHAVAELGEPC